jgi:hypothetical protein
LYRAVHDALQVQLGTTAGKEECKERGDMNSRETHQLTREERKKN